MVRNHVDLPGERSCDWRLLADLRALDPELDLHYVGKGAWALGAVRWTIDRYNLAGRRLRLTETNSPSSVRLCELAMQGFARIALYRIQGEPTSEIVLDFKEREWRYRHGRDREFEEKLKHSSGHYRRERMHKSMLDEIEAREKDSWANFFRGRRSYDMGRIQ